LLAIRFGGVYQRVPARLQEYGHEGSSVGEDDL